MQKDTIIECDIESLAYGGRGVARVDGRVVFVERALPGQTVKARLVKVKKRFAEAVLEAVTERSPEQAEPFCRHFGECGGCLHQDLAYDAQLREKHAQVRDAMERLGGLEFQEVLEPVGSPRIQGYRNKMEFAFTGQGDNLVLGLRRRGAKEVVDVPGCRLMHDDAIALVREAAEFCRETNIPSWSPRNRKGYWRHLVVRRSEADGRKLVHLITTPDKAKHDAAKALGEYLTAEMGADGFVHSTRKSGLELAFGERRVMSLGRPRLLERLSTGSRELRFHISADAFFQPNTETAGILCRTVLEFAGLGGNEHVLDLYCGAGGFALTLADHARKVTGLEVVPAAVEDALRNAEVNGLENCTFEVRDLDGDKEEELRLPQADVVVCDPPRGGMSAPLVQALRRMAPSRVVAVSCDPPALARDAAELGYVPKRLITVDQFPHTAHVECVALLERES
ncbi:23S rRNA (uracil1939-C5)-methyltransferase [Paucidesulfovibrio gracilis DSM 16080]|uniref:23S rRNA (Uracil1939-C5)-methyltransferase n=1 Tax=Paucidesulfovibrio gracilis DSM 16080 TaxID=1121449 RepID=A0A1T4W557_9BACT|nr:23S rRNA (uracil(1939)-C(5))-methyltransferase RlmD [Paucidesulfovibrio gracilis]SKA72337.1 23S rRNA (uracil1939-C5)-methyltransferase [Paucidesulfovibrio gracilis DSM 16080]